MSVNRKVTVPVGGLATTTSMSSLLPSRGHYSSGGFLGSSVNPTSTSGSWPTVAESRTSQVRSRIRCIRMLRDQVGYSRALGAQPDEEPYHLHPRAGLGSRVA